MPAFTLMELLVVSMLMAGLTIIAATSWRYLTVQMTDCTARARAAQELRFAVENIAQDMGAAVGATPVGGNGVLLCLDGGSNPNGQADWASPDVLVQYSVSDGQLVRYDQSAGTEVTVAGDVSSLVVENVTATLLRIVVQVRRSDVTRQATLFWSKP